MKKPPTYNLTFGCPHAITGLCKYKRTDTGRFNTHVYTLLDGEKPPTI